MLRFLALLFYLEAVKKVRDNKTLTHEKAYWMLPASCKEVPYKENDIDFMSPGTLRKKIDKRVVDNGNQKIQELPTYVSEFYKSLSGCKSKPAILFIIPKKLSGFYDQLKENSLNYFGILQSW